MILPDVNVFVYGHRKDLPEHRDYLRWWEGLLDSDSAFGVSDLVLSSFLRIVTGTRFFADPSPLPTAFTFVDEIRSHPNCVLISPGERHWEIFVKLCRTADARGNLIADAYLAAMAIESGSEWITADRDYARFPGLRWRHPLE